MPASETDKRALRFASCGLPLPGHEVRVTDKTGNELPERQEGRLQFRGPSATSGYFRNPEETRRLFHKEWLNSGDLAYIAGGEVYITGRSKDIIIHAGRNIYPHELEEAIGNIPDIRKGCVAVFGSLQPDSGTEQLVVVAETRKNEPKVLDQLRSEINAVAVDILETPPDDVVLAAPHSIPKTSSGKIRRAASRELYENKSMGKPRKAMWWQVARLMFSGIVPQIERASRVVSDALYAAYTWSLFVLLLPIVWFSVVLLPGVSLRWMVMRAAARFLAGASGISLSVKGLEHLPPLNQPCILASNHSSYIDNFVLVAVLPREISFVAKKELTGSFLTRMPLLRIGTEFVDRFDKQKSIKDTQRLASTTRSGRSLLFYPEGTFSRMPGLLPFHMGAFVVAVEGKAPVIPIAIRGTRSILRPDSWIPRRGAITVTICKPVKPEELETKTSPDSWSTALKLCNVVREQILRFSGEPDLAHEKSPAVFTRLKSEND